MLNWWQWLILASLPPLVIMLYFLKLRRVPIEVPSTYLWRRTVEDMHVNSIWQRLRRNLLLLLQLLTLLAIILSVLRPGIRDDQTIGKRSMFLIDQSASMQATDLEKSRLQIAKEQAIKMIDGMGGDDDAMVIAFSDRADVVQGFTSDKRRLREAIEAIGPTNRTTNITEALNTASGLAGPVPTTTAENRLETRPSESAPATVYLFSDGRFDSPPNEYENVAVEYMALGSSAVENLGIVAFTCERNPEKQDRVEAFARVQNFGRAPATSEVTLNWNGKLADASTVSVEAGETKGLSFEITGALEGHLELRLEAKDPFPVDNGAFAALTPPRQLEVVLVTRGNTALAAALQTQQASSTASIRVIAPDELESDTGKQLAASGSIDLFVYDACVPPTMPEANTLFLGALPPGEVWKASDPSGPLFVIDVHRTHPLMQYVELGSLLIAEGIGLELPPTATELARTEAGVLMAVAPRGSYQDCVVGMVLHGGNTNWPNRRSFPIFLLNALEFLGGASSATGARSFQPGQPAVIHVANRYDQVLISTPSGKEHRLSRHGQPQVVFSQTDDLGAFIVQDPEQGHVLQTFTVNLFSDQESNIATLPEVQIGSQAVQAVDHQPRRVRKEYWRWLLVAALIALSIEWVVYIKRIAV